MTWTAWLPIEPCAKERPRVTRNGTYMSKRYTGWRKRFCLMAQGSWKDTFENSLPKSPLTGPLHIIVMVYTKSGKMRPDLDNVGAACLDALQDAGVIANDRDARRLEFILDKDKTPGIDITVESYQ